MFDLPPESVENLYRATAAILALIGLAACRGRGATWTVAWGAVLLLLISPYSRKAHFVLLLPAFSLVWESLLAGTARRPRVVATLLALAFVLGQLSTPALWGKSNAALLLGAGVVGMAAMVILPAMWIIRPRNHAHGPLDPHP